MQKEVFQKTVFINALILPHCTILGMRNRIRIPPPGWCAKTGGVLICNNLFVLLYIKKTVQDEFLQRLMGGCRSPLVCLNPSQWALTQRGSPFSFRALRGNPASRRTDQLLPTRSSSPLCFSEPRHFLQEGHAKSHFNELSRQDPLHNKNISIQTVSYHYHAIMQESAERKDQYFFFFPFQFRNINPLLIAWGQWC